jgi:hypothetical protein
LYAGRFEEAASLHEVSVAVSERTLGPEHVDTLVRILNLGDTYRTLGRLGESIVLLEKAEAGMRLKLGNEHPDAMTAMHFLASSYRDAGRADD